MKDLSGWVWNKTQVFKGRGYLEGELVNPELLAAHKPQLINEERITEATKYWSAKAKDAEKTESKGGK